ncbi:MAG: hypothetical protein SNJ82_01260 [Gemmataceae bacterium]
MIRVFSRFLDDLLAGDPIGLSCAGILTVGVMVALLVWWKIACDLHREDEERKNRWRKKELAALGVAPKQQAQE